MIPESLSLNPTYLAPSAWWQHVPIAYWLVEKIEPKRIVELGTHYGVSFFAFCEAAEAFSPDTFTYAIDSWGGDEHSAYYGEEVFAKVKNYWETKHKHRSSLVRSRFETALEYFEDNSIDILHIDGLHTYESVKHDFETWLPKMREDSLILLHDINVRENEFGVWKLWQELKSNYATFEVLNGHGLGVLMMGKKMSNILSEFSDLTSTFASKGLLLEKIAQLTPEGCFGLHPVEQAKAEAEEAKAEAEEAKAEAEEAKAWAIQVQAERDINASLLMEIKNSKLWRYANIFRNIRYKIRSTFKFY